ncbi:MAG: hypothetical protein ACTSSI_08520 [Candidatus Helarchaeota archaeon]
MGRDRTSTVRVGCFTIHTDKDHKGFFRGYQAMGNGYRGWHYHIESEEVTQIEILLLLEMELLQRGAIHVDVDRRNLYIGSLDRNPLLYRVWTRDDKTTVLWIGKYGSLHVEANKRNTYTKSILKKDDLIRMANGWTEKLENKYCVFFRGEFEYEDLIDCEHCTYSSGTCRIGEVKVRLEAEMSSNQVEITRGGEEHCANV